MITELPVPQPTTPQKIYTVLVQPAITAEYKIEKRKNEMNDKPPKLSLSLYTPSPSPLPPCS